jgi:hypothetical protein
MLPVNTYSTELPAGWFALVLLLGTAILFGKQAAAWLLMKLYELFIGSKNHPTPIGK